ncbi:non-ribosomal peptide synthetase [Vibrio spartinae]|uniref:Linear gramicidin synthase subunit D n=1 Tax=Vibrio spartinae TaxID=1918945 RepID=A0A1N6M7P2_9VIBR|nr:non-ribosomal peptide synthetase [Vibrio spartinae]SIO95380.1 Linear gramicidin synthase subunit D [Vibrio spartinae]
MKQPSPLSFAQQRLWLLETLAQSGSALHVPSAIHLSGPIDVAILEQALLDILWRHETWRSRFTVIDGVPQQQVMPLPDVFLCQEPSSSATLQSQMQAEIDRPFDLGTGLPVRAVLFLLGEQEFVLCVTAHHLVADGWSLGLFWEELSRRYCAALSGEVQQQPEPNDVFTALVAQEARHLDDKRKMHLIDWWRDYLGDEPSGVSLPPDKILDDGPNRCSGRYVSVIDSALADNFRQLGKQLRATPFMMMIAAFSAVLSRYSDGRQVLLGCPIAQRTSAESRQVLGLLLDTLIVRADFSGRPSFAQLVERVRDDTLDAMDHRDLPFQQLVQALKPEHSAGQVSLVNVMLNFQSRQSSSVGALSGDTVSTPLDVAPSDVMTDLTLYVMSDQYGLKLTWEYAAERFDETAIVRLAHHLQQLMIQVVRAPDCPLKSLELASQPAQPSAVAPDHDFTVAARFAAVAGQSPERTALIQDNGIEGGEVISYQRLMHMAAAIRQQLDRYGITVETPVGILMERSVSRVAAFLAVSACGATIVPLDPAYPHEWLNAVLTQVRPGVLLCDELTSEATDSHDVIDRVCCPVLHVPGEITTSAAEIASADFAAQVVTVSADAVAYILFTSGSTGQPKGVMGTHRGLANRLGWMWQQYPFAQDDIAFQQVSPNFVDSLWDLWGPLLAGVPVVLPPQDISREPQRFLQQCLAYRVTRLTLVPSLLDVLLQEMERNAIMLQSLRLCISSGEALPRALVTRFQTLLPDVQLLNLYGSSEVAADVTYREITIEDVQAPVVPVGFSIARTDIHLLDDELYPTPLGAWGEVYVAGASLARGYWQQPNLTAAAFIPHPFGLPGERLYRTGDIGRWRSDGALILGGRADSQIKIRGVRVEPTWVEEMIRNYPGVDDAAVTAGEETPTVLTAWICGNVADEEVLRQFLSRRLPAQMIPARIAFVQSLPRLSNGKVDRKRLRSERVITKGGHTATVPEGETEQALVELWATLLQYPADSLSVTANIFDLGGHSLLMVQAHALIQKHLASDCQLTDLFRYTTIRSLARYLAQLACETETSQYQATEYRQGQRSRSHFRRQSRAARRTTLRTALPK